MSHSPFEPNPVYSLRETVVGVGLLFGVVLAVLVVASFPMAAAAGVGGSLAVTGVGWTALALRRRLGRRRTICIPHTGVCIEA